MADRAFRSTCTLLGDATTIRTIRFVRIWVALAVRFRVRDGFTSLMSLLRCYL